MNSNLFGFMGDVYYHIYIHNWSFGYEQIKGKILGKIQCAADQILGSRQRALMTRSCFLFVESINCEFLIADRKMVNFSRARLLLQPPVINL